MLSSVFLHLVVGFSVWCNVLAPLISKSFVQVRSDVYVAAIADDGNFIMLKVA
jgi:hypothetical protein